MLGGEEDDEAGLWDSIWTIVNEVDKEILIDFSSGNETQAYPPFLYLNTTQLRNMKSKRAGGERE